MEFNESGGNREGKDRLVRDLEKIKLGPLKGRVSTSRCASVVLNGNLNKKRNLNCKNLE